MAIFPRRKLQAFINENARFMSVEQLERHVRHLNASKADHKISTEWEVVLLNAFSKLGTVHHEANLGGGNFADVLFQSAQNPTCEILLDITSVSDKGAEVENNVEPFHRLLNERTRNYIEHGSFFVEVKYRKDYDQYGREKKVARLPQPKDFTTEIFNQEFKAFLKRIDAALDRSHIYKVDTESTGIVIRYNPGERDSVFLGVSYRKAVSIKNNAIWNSLNGKAEQLKRINFLGPKGIVLCDGGCEALFSKSYMPERFPAKKIVNEFLKHSSSIDFIYTIATVQFDSGKRHSFGERPPRHVLEPKLYCNPKSTHQMNEVVRTFDKLIEYLPIPDASAEEVRINLANGVRYKKGSSYFGGCTVSDAEYKLSLRELYEVLCGNLDDADQTNQSVNLDVGRSRVKQMFRSFYREGRAIEQITIEPSEDDDNWVVFKFSATRDPAISQFTIPKN